MPNKESPYVCMKPFKRWRSPHAMPSAPLAWPWYVNIQCNIFRIGQAPIANVILQSCDVTLSYYHILVFISYYETTILLEYYINRFYGCAIVVLHITLLLKAFYPTPDYSVPTTPPKTTRTCVRSLWGRRGWRYRGLSEMVHVNIKNFRNGSVRP